MFQNAVRQEREDIRACIVEFEAKELDKQEKAAAKAAERRSASAGRTVSDVLRDAPLAEAYVNSRGSLTLDYRTSRSRSHGR